jgi:PST family polysaccharide transporter
MTTIEIFALNLGLIIAYKISKLKFTKIKVSKEKVLHLFKVCWPLIFSTLAITIYMKSDQLMIGSMLGNYELGIYSVAVRLAEYWYFIPGAIYTSVLPILSSYYRKNNHQQFIQKLESVSDLLAVMGYLAAIFFTIFSESIVGFLYGSEYAESGEILTVYIWAGLFICLGNVKLIYCTLREFSKFQLLSTSICTILNIILNYLFIPLYGAMGAAISTVITQAFNGWLSCILMKETREIFIMESKSLFPFLRVGKRLCIFLRRVN